MAVIRQTTCGYKCETTETVSQFPLKAPNIFNKGPNVPELLFPNNAYFGIFSSIIISITDILPKIFFSNNSVQ